MLSGWTIGRATGVGVTAGLAAIVLWPLYAVYQDRVLAPFVAALAVATLCGLSILWITLVDLVTHRRGERVRPLRAFDLAVALLLALPSLAQLEALLS